MIQNAYPDEKDKLNSEFENELTVWIKIQEALDEGGYSLEAVKDEYGVAVLQLTKEI